MSLQVGYYFTNADGVEIDFLELPDATPGSPSSSIELRLIREQSENLGPSPAAVVESAIMLGATLFNRSLSDGDNADGLEVVTESWLEVSTDGETWEPVGAGPSLDVASWFDIATEPISSPQSKTFYLRLNVPGSPSTTGDFKVTLEIFIR